MAVVDVGGEGDNSTLNGVSASGAVAMVVRAATISGRLVIGTVLTSPDGMSCLVAFLGFL